MLPSISLLRLSCRPGANAFLRGTRTANQSSGVRSVVSLIRPSVSRDLQSPSCQHFLRYSSQKSVEARSLHSLSCRFQEINPRKGDKEKDTSAIQKSEQEKRENRMIFVRKVVDQAKDTSYILALIAFGGFVVLGIGKSLWTYLLSPNSSQRLYSKAVKMAKKDADIVMLLGEPMTAHGEGTRRRDQIYEERFFDQEARENVILRFYLDGPRGRGISYAHYVKDGRSFVMKNYWVDVNNSRRVVLVKEGEEMVAASSSDNY